MAIFGSLYQVVIKWSEHKHAEKYLLGMSVAESSFFPIPVDVLLAPMVLARPEKWLRLALMVTITSVLGGVIGFYIGAYFFDWVSPILQERGMWQNFVNARQWFDRWGLWIVFVAGFSPVPYKVFTIAAGSLGMALIPFVLVSLVARAARFFLVAYIVKLSADKIKSIDLKWIEVIGWFMALTLVVVIWLKW